MKKVRGLKAILASFLVTVALAAPAAVLSSQTEKIEAELYFTGVSLEMLPDGTIQAIFEVSVDTVLNCDGASFVLDYNPDYFTPSYIDSTTHQRNTAFTPTTDPNDDGFFAYDRTLYKPDVSPFQKEVTYRVDTGSTVIDNTSKYSTVVLGQHTITMDLWIDREKVIKNQPTTGTGLKKKPVEKPVGKLTPLRGVSLGGQTGGENETVYVIRKYDTRDTEFNIDPNKLERVALGQLSFRVNPDRLDEIARYFPQPAEKTTIAEKTLDGVESYLIRTTEPEGVSGRDNWQIGTFQRDEDTTDSLSKRYYRENRNYRDDAAGEAERYYELAVDPKQIMKVRPAEKEVTINAYQAFTDGTWGDVAQALRRYSPMATVTYVDGTQENLVIPWGKDGDEYEYTVTAKGTDGKFHPVDLTDNSTYNPLEGVYQITQYVPGKSIHPIPITVTLTVTPIKLLDVQVENQVLTYDLDNVVSQVRSPSDLHLPEKARLITDIVPSGVSMVMKIPGWKPEKGSWPIATDSNASILMNDLKEDSFGTSDAPSSEEGFDGGTMPYWPDDEDMGAISRDEYHKFLKQKKNGVELGHWIGEYTFHIADKPGGTVKEIEIEEGAAKKTIEGFAKAEIQEAFPWLTVEKEGYPVPTALRQIVTADSFTNAGDYVASYVSTTVGPDTQPELTLSVRRGNSTVMEEDSIFRVWLPNGLELGTGLVKDVWPDTHTEVDDWFPKDAGGNQNGHYKKEKIDEAANNRFHLVMNPGDPTTGVEQANRETLRRYINLGGWYQVAVCEDPLTRTWSDPMPVFVPPRPNEYQSDKEYNFVGENTELFRWPGGLTHYVTMPQGTYTAVTKDGARLYDVAGESLTVAEIQAKAAAQENDPNATPRYGDYLDDKGRPKTSTLRHEEFYGYHTTYDGSTGAQPGTLYSFQVGSMTQPQPVPGDVWNHVAETFSHDPSAIPAGTGVGIWRYGPDPFYDGAIYPSFGTVTQPANTRPADSQPASAEPYKVTVRRDGVADKEKGKPKITLTSDSPFGITRVDPNDMGSNVTLATYDTRKEGYTDRQEYTFTITNIGTAPVYGLAIDGLTDGYVNDPTGGRFVMLQAPASFLAPGQSTTFVLTYVYNLDANGVFDQSTGQTTPDIYRDTLYIISSDHPNGKKGGTNQEQEDENGNFDYLLDFDAEFKVADKDTHIVTVVVRPGDYSMGTAGLIVGEQSGAMNYTVTTRAYAAGEYVYVAVYMKDEYKLRQDPTRTDAAGDPVTIPQYKSADHGGIALRPDIYIYQFPMGDYDTTVVVEFYEDIFSKLRLSDLIDFSAPVDDRLKPLVGNKVAGEDPAVDGLDTYRVWRKSYTDDEKKDAKDWHDTRSQTPEEDLYLATVGTTVPKNKDGNKFISTENQYIVVIPCEADRSQVQVKLRALETYSDYTGVYNDPNHPEYESDGSLKKFNTDIKPTVIMHHYKSGFEAAWPTDPNVSVGDVSLTVVDPQGDTAGPTTHYSMPFDSPVPGTSDYVRITVSYENESRSYYLEIHRAPKDPIATLNYGNSPYGMIMNDTSFHRGDPVATKDAQDDAKAAFRNNGYTFYTTNPIKLHVPHVVRDGKVSEEAVYWREAWVHNNQLFEPESLTGFIVTYPSPTPDPDPSASPTPDSNRREPVSSPDPLVYKDEENLDLNDYAYFAILGENMKEPGVAEALDSTGRPVKLEDIHARVTVTLLDNDADTQIGRFSGAETATLDLGNLKEDGRGKILGWLPEPAVVNAAQAGKWNVSSEVDPDTGEKTYTQVEHIRPGQYVLEYVYSDYNGEPLKVTRSMVILSSVGDVNCDGGTVTKADETTLKNRVADPLGYVAGRGEQSGKVWVESVYPRANIFKYRVVDVNNDRNVNNIDGNLINKIVRSKAEAIRFYNPIYYTYPST